MKYIIYLVLFAFSFCNLSSLEPELYNPEGVTFGTNNNGGVTFSADFIEYNEEIYVVASDEQNGPQIWKFDGSENGIQRVTDFPETKELFLIDIVNDKLLFAMPNEGKTQLWSLDNELSSTLLHAFDFPIFEFVFLVGSEHTINYKELFYLNIFNGSNQQFELWVTDGTKENTFNHSERNNIPNVLDFTLLNNKTIVFGKSESSSSGQTTIELYSTNFDDETVKLSEFEGGLHIINERNEILNQDKIFIFNDLSYYGESSIWLTDGSNKGTYKFIELGENAEFVFGENYVKKINDSYLLKYKSNGIDSGNKTQIMLTDGTKENSVIINNHLGYQLGAEIKFIDIVNKRFVFAVSYEDSLHLWSTDGSVEGTKLLMKKEASLTQIPNSNVTNLGGKLYFIIHENNKVFELVETDGTKESTQVVSEFYDDSMVLTSNETYNDNVLIVSKSEQLKFYSTSTGNLDSVKLNNSSLSYNIIKYNDSLYIKFDAHYLYYFDNNQNSFIQIIPEGEVRPTYALGEGELLYKDFLYFIANYYDDGYKLYRIDNTFQTMSNVEVPSTNELKLYPNPTGDFLNISVDEPTSVSIIDLTGKVVMSIENYSGEGINTSNLPAGVYNIILDENTHGGKFVKE